METPVNATDNSPCPNDGDPRLREALENAQRFFWCNTARDVGPGSNILERRMYEREFAAAWTAADNDRFNFEDHMQRVQGGDLIVMYANLLGIIGIGQAKAGGPSILGPNDPDRMRCYGDAEGHNKQEWRIPVDWLRWDEGNPCPIDWLRCSFQEITEHDERLQVIRQHFLPGVVPSVP